jgi:signal transduction histidine kinase
MNTLSKLPTYFAPAERVDDDTIRQQADYFADQILLQHMLDAVPDVFLILNEQRQVIYANQALLDLLSIDNAATIYGLRPGELFGCVHAVEGPHGCGTSEACGSCGALRAILNSLRGENAIEECRIALRDGQSLDLRVWGKPLQIGDQMMSLFTIKDISDEKRRRALERIFFHDILNTAGVLQGFAGLLKDATDDEMLVIKEQFPIFTMRLVEEIQAQRELAAAESDDLDVQPELIDTLAFVREICTMYGEHPVSEGRIIELIPPDQPIELVSDATLLRRVLGNMLKNALEASKPGETVTVRCMLADDQVHFMVHNPVFIPRKVQMEIFKRSFSTKGSGRGLGTYSMRLLTERYLRGSVGFTSTHDGGTTFTASYPPHL